MKVDVSPFGAFRNYKLASHVTRQLAEGARVSDLHDALSAHGQVHWPGFRKGLWRRPAFAREKRIFRDAEALPDDGRMVPLPPMDGGCACPDISPWWSTRRPRGLFRSRRSTGQLQHA